MDREKSKKTIYYIKSTRIYRRGGGEGGQGREYRARIERVSRERYNSTLGIAVKVVMSSSSDDEDSHGN